MSGRPRFYLAIGIFYESDRLRAAASSLLAQGFSPETLWQFAARGPGLAPTEPPCRFELRTFPPELMTEAVRDREGEDAGLSCLCLNALMAGNVGIEIRRHIERSATVLVAGTEGSDLHDQCVKVLLRHSLHTVHSEEIGPPG